MLGNTWTSKQEWGNWAEYHADSSTGVAKAWGTWGVEYATSTYLINDDGQGCWSYTGEPQWASPENKYCSVVMVDSEGNTYSKVTQNTKKPERVGKQSKFEILAGDVLNLAEQ